MKIIGLTGGIASGKTTVARLFMEQGVPVCDTDVIARNIVQPQTQGLKRLVDTFGVEILTHSGSLDREKLANLIFNDDTKRRKVNELLHPIIFEEIQIWLSRQISPIVVIDMPLLFEVGYEKKVNCTVVVFVEEQTQLERLMNRNNYTQSQALRRIMSQMPLREKMKRADKIIDNNGTIEQTRQQVRDYVEQLKYDIMNVK